MRIRTCPPALDAAGTDFVSAITVAVPPPQTVGKPSGFRPDSRQAAT